MKLFKKATLLGLLSLSAPIWATPGVYEINSACLDVGCFTGDDPNTRTVEINKRSGTFRLTSDLIIGLDAIVVDYVAPQAITIDLNGFEIRNASAGSGNTAGIIVNGQNSFVTIKNGSIIGYLDGIKAGLGAAINVDNMLFRLMRDDAIQGGIGRITNSTFDCNDYGVNATGLSGNTEGDRWYLANNIFSCGEASADRPVFSLGANNICKDNIIAYDAGVNTHFGACQLSGSNYCNGQLCAQGASQIAADDSKE